MIELRDYQTDAIERAAAGIDDRPILVAPAGSGKTVMGVRVAQRAGGRVVWVAHRIELLEQAARAVTEAGGDAAIVAPGFAARPSAQFQVCSVQTLARRGTPPCDLLVIDECHHTAAKSYHRLIGPWRMLGLTATPFRLDGAGLDPPFKSIVESATPLDLCRRGILVEPQVYAYNDPDLRGVHSRMGDWVSGELGEAMSKQKLVANIVSTWQKYAAGRRTVCFAVNIRHSRFIVERFLEAGIPAEHLDADSEDRAAVYRRLADGTTQVVSNVNLWTEGTDLPALEVAILARPTKSLALHIQQIGRVMRSCLGKEGALVLDHAGNHGRHGMATDPVPVTLQGVTPTKRSAVSTSRCPSCFMILPLRWEVCPGCGMTRPKPEIPKEDHERELALLRPAVVIPFPIRKEYWDEIESIRIARGYQPGWSAYRYQSRFGVFPTVIDGELVDPKTARPDAKRRLYRDLLLTARSRGYKDGWASFQFKQKLGDWPEWSMQREVQRTL